MSRADVAVVHIALGGFLGYVLGSTVLIPLLSIVNPNWNFGLAGAVIGAFVGLVAAGRR